VLITRSQPGASVLASALEVAGFACEVAPLVEIERIAAGVDALHEISDRDVVVFTSVHAVEHAFALVECARIRLPTEAAWIAIGTATAKALARFGIQATTPEVETSEGALSMRALARVDGLRVMIVGGVGGRRALDDALRARGATVARANVYRRRAAAADRAVLGLRAGSVAAIVVSSVEGGRLLARAWRESDESGEAARLEPIADLPLIVPSPRVASALAALGFRRTIVSEGASAAAVIAALREARIGGAS